MPSPFAHYAFAALALGPFRLNWRDRAAWALLGVAPDLDAFTAITWAVVAPHLPLSADALILGSDLLSHRGFSHTFAMAAIIGLVAWRRTGSRRWGLVGFTAWASHPVADLFTPWGVAPLWPFIGASWNRSLVTSADPLMTALAGLASVGLLAWLVRDSAFTARPWLARWRDRAKRTAPVFVLATALVFPFSIALMGAVSSVNDVPFSSVHPASLPRTMTVTELNERFLIEVRLHPWAEAATLSPLRVEAAPGTDPGEAVLMADLTACAIEGIGPYAAVSEPAFRANGTMASGEVRVVDVLRNATGESPPAMTFVIEDGRVVEAGFAGRGRLSWLRVEVPPPVVEALTCRST